MRMWYAAKVLLCVAGFASLATAQQTVAPGDPSLRPRRVRLVLDTIVVLRTPRDSAEVVSSILYRRVERVSGRDGALLRETQRYESREPSRPGMSYDTLDVNLATLRPARSFFNGGGTSYDVRFTDLTMDGFLTIPDSAPRPIQRTLPNAAFPSMMQEAFIAAFPFGPIGSSLTLPMMNPPDTALRQIQFDVARAETLRTADGPISSLLITSGNGNVQFWIAADDGRLLRMHWTLPNGMSIWKLPQHDTNFRDGGVR